MLFPYINADTDDHNDADAGSYDDADTDNNFDFTNDNSDADTGSYADADTDYFDFTSDADYIKV